MKCCENDAINVNLCEIAVILCFLAAILSFSFLANLLAIAQICFVKFILIRARMLLFHCSARYLLWLVLSRASPGSCVQDCLVCFVSCRVVLILRTPLHSTQHTRQSCMRGTTSPGAPWAPYGRCSTLVSHEAATQLEGEILSP